MFKQLSCLSSRIVSQCKRAFSLASDDTSKIKTFKPVTPSMRHTVLLDRSELWKGRPVAALTKGKRKSGGRSHGRIAVRCRGGGHKQLYRFVDFKRTVQEQSGVVQRLEYDPNRTAYIALLSYPDGTLSYILAPHGIQPGDSVMASKTQELEIKPGNSLPIRSIPIGTYIHNVELRPGKGGKFARAAGCAAQLIDKVIRPGYALVALASKEQRFISLDCMATIGSLANSLHKIRKLGKAGRSRWMGRRPHVRGVAMNPVDHPMGGGQGKTSGGRPSCSRTGVLAKGYKTRDKKKSRDMILVPRGGLKKGQAGVAMAA